MLGVPAGVEGEVVAAREPATAVGALEGLCAGVLPVVAGEFVGAGEAPLAPLPRARVRLLTWGGEKKTKLLSGKMEWKWSWKWLIYILRTPKFYSSRLIPTSNPRTVTDRIHTEH